MIPSWLAMYTERVCAFVAFLFRFRTTVKTPKCTLHHYQQRIITAIVVHTFKFILRVTATIHKYIRFNECARTTRSSLNQIFYLCTHFSPNTHFQREFAVHTRVFIHFHLNTFQIIFLVHDITDAYKFLCFTFRLALRGLSFLLILWFA